MMVTRRRLIGAMSLAVALPRLVLAEKSADGFQVLKAQIVQASLLENPKLKTETWRLTPDAITLLRLKQGEECRVRIINMLEREIWFHWFGVRGPSEVMTLNIQPGEDNAVDCVFTPPDAGTFWFGPLTDASLLRDKGLYGMLVVEEKITVEPQLFDLPIIIDDWMLGDDGKMVQNFGDLEAAVGEGRMGNWFTLNSQYRPHLKMPADKACRLRILNAANVRSMNLQFKGADPLIVALDGQPMAPRHSGERGILLAPGQRVDLLFDTGSESISLALDLFEDIVEIGYIDREGSPDAAVLPENFSLPANAILTTIDFQAAVPIPVIIAGGVKGGLKSAKFRGEVLDTRGLLQQGIAWALNDVAGPGSEPLAKILTGRSVVMTIDNRTAFEQPLHLHGHVWQLIEEASERRENQPWRDTTVVPAMTTQKLAFVANNPGLWLLQSLVAERVDSGLLASFDVEAAPTP